MGFKTWIVGLIALILTWVSACVMCFVSDNVFNWVAIELIISAVVSLFVVLTVSLN